MKKRVNVWIDDDRLARLATDLRIAKSALIEQALDQFDPVVSTMRNADHLLHLQIAGLRALTKSRDPGLRARAERAMATLYRARSELMKENKL